MRCFLQLHVKAILWLIALYLITAKQTQCRKAE